MHGIAAQSRCVAQEAQQREALWQGAFLRVALKGPSPALPAWPSVAWPQLVALASELLTRNASFKNSVNRPWVMMPPGCRACSVWVDWQDGKGRQAYSLVMMTAYTITPINAPVGAVA